MQEKFQGDSDLKENELRILRDRIVRLEIMQEELISAVKRERNMAVDFRDKTFLFLFVIFAFLCSVLMMQDEVDEDSSGYEEYVTQEDDAVGFEL